MLMAAVVLIPAQHSLDLAMWRRDRTLAAEMHRLERITRHELYLDAVKRRDETVLRQLAARQLGLAPAHSEVILLADSGDAMNASVFDTLEPDGLKMPEGPAVRSVLGRLATDERARLWLLAAASFLVLIGLLPPGVRGSRDAA
jgi:hypothetical protein